MLRTSPLLDVLLSKTKQQVLAATLLQPERSWYFVELARHLQVTPSSLQREIRLLTEGGILKRHQSGNRVYFQADITCPIFPELAQILFKTVGVVEALRKALMSLENQINVAFVYGSVAASAERSTSDVDLMVVGSASLSKIAPLVRSLERQIGRAINPTVYATDEFEKKVRRGDHFLERVLREKPIFIFGGSDELANLTAGTARKDAPHEHSRAKRSTGGR